MYPLYKPIAKYYHDALDFAQFQISSGVTDYRSAIKSAVKKLSESGLRYVDYESGWSNRLDVAVRRATLTGANQMSQQMTILGMEELGCEYVETSAHAGARPDHAKWQGKVFIWKGRSGKYENFEEATGYGTGDGICGWNCRHSFFPFFPGITKPAYTKKQLDNIDPKDIFHNGIEYTYYEATQRQRQIETMIRKTKRELILYKETGLKEEFSNTSIKLQREKQAYKEFCKAAGLRIKNDRHQVLGFDKSISQKSVHEANKVFVSNLKKLGISNPPRSEKAFNRLKFDNPREYKLLNGYLNAVNKGDISVLAGFETYNKVAKEIEEKLLGITTKNGILISDYSAHFIDRVIGQYEESNEVLSGKRKGVKIDLIKETLINPTSIGKETVNKNGQRSIVLKGIGLEISINPDDNTLVQTNPIKSKGVKLKQ